MDRMTASQFNDWREASAFFFDYLEEELVQEAVHFAEIGQSLASATPEYMKRLQLVACQLEARGLAIRQILALGYDDIFRENNNVH